MTSVESEGFCASNQPWLLAALARLHAKWCVHFGIFWIFWIVWTLDSFRLFYSGWWWVDVGWCRYGIPFQTAAMCRQNYSRSKPSNGLLKLPLAWGQIAIIGSNRAWGCIREACTWTKVLPFQFFRTSCRGYPFCPWLFPFDGWRFRIGGEEIGGEEWDVFTVIWRMVEVETLG